MAVRRIPIGKGYYEVDDEKKTYRFLSQNKHWKLMTPEKDKANKESVKGYTRLRKDGSKM